MLQALYCLKKVNHYYTGYIATNVGGRMHVTCFYCKYDPRRTTTGISCSRVVLYTKGFDLYKLLPEGAIISFITQLSTVEHVYLNKTKKLLKEALIQQHFRYSKHHKYLILLIMALHFLDWSNCWSQFCLAPSPSRLSRCQSQTHLSPHFLIRWSSYWSQFCLAPSLSHLKMPIASTYQHIHRPSLDL